MREDRSRERPPFVAAAQRTKSKHLKNSKPAALAGEPQRGPPPHRFAGIPRGRALPGPREIANHIWGDANRWRTVHRLDRERFGLLIIANKITGFAGWIDHAIETGVSPGEAPPARTNKAEAASAAP
jgi:hypothetical protein